MPKNVFPMPTAKNGFHILNLHLKNMYLKNNLPIYLKNTNPLYDLNYFLHQFSRYSHI